LFGVALAAALLLGGCGYLSQVGEEGGLWAKIKERREAPVAPLEPPRSDAPAQEAQASRPKPPATESSFSQHSSDRFFSLHWSYWKPNAETFLARGIIENRNGPVMREVVVELSSLDESGRVLRQERQGIRGPLDSRATRPFEITIRLTGEERTFNVSIASYEFTRAKDAR
jgi:hypothetical protein